MAASPRIWKSVSLGFGTSSRGMGSRPGFDWDEEPDETSSGGMGK
jgi:hypothetical protein